MHKKTLSQLIIACCPLILSSPLHADSTQLDQMVVSATPTPNTLGNLGSSVTVVTQQEIKQKHFITLSDALISVPGIQIFSTGGRGSQTSVFSRGSNSNHTLVLVDGVEMNDPSSPTGSFDFANFLLDDVKSIEIVRGSQAVLYGADAIGAVISITTAQGEGSISPSLKLQAGTKSTYQTSLGLSGSNNGLDYSFTGGILESDGDSVSNQQRIVTGSNIDDDGYQNKLFSSNIGYQFNEQIEARITARYIDSTTDIDGGFDFSGNALEDLDAYNKAEQWYVGSSLNGRFFSGKWLTKLAYSFSDINRENRNKRQSLFGNANTSDYDGRRDKLKLQNDLLFFNRHIISLGYEFEKEQLDSEGELSLGSFVLTQSDDAERLNRAIYLYDQFNVTDAFTLTAGMRNDHTDDFASEFTYGLTANYQLSQTSTLRVAHGTGFKAPSLYEMYGYTPNNFGSAYFGNPDLKPETSQSWELGLDQAFFANRLYTQFTLFKTNIDDLITTQFLPSFDSTSVNQDESEVYGLETSFDFAISPKVQLQLNYTYTHARDDENKELLRRPQNQASSSLHFVPTAKFNTTLTLDYIGSRKDIDGLGATTDLGGYTLVNWVANYQISSNTELFTKIENLTNKEYEPIYGYQGTGFTGLIGIHAKL